jgi:hypothetical protein
MGRTGTTGLVAGIATGVGLWFTRAALDVVPAPGGGRRVAMLGSWPELVGLVCLVLLSAFLCRASMVWLGRSSANGVPRPGRVPPHVLLPLGLALLLGVPYMPWAADAVPVLRVLAGPARFGLWIVAVGLTAWLAWEFHAEAGDPVVPRPGRMDWRPAAVFVASVAIVGAAAGQLAGHGLYPGGDEPHYLVITQSLLEDGDLRIENNHSRRGYAAYFAGDLRPDYIARGRDGAIYSIHPIGLPLLVAPAFAVAGYPGVVWLLVIVAAAGATLLWSVARKVSGSASGATTAWLAVAGSTPFVLLGFSVYPEITAAGCALAALCWPGREDGDPVRTWCLRGLAVALLPWLGTKYAPMSAVIVAALALRAWRTESTTRLVAAAIPWTVSVACWLAFFDIVWGTPLPTAPYGAATQTSLRNLLVGGPALFVDQEYGVFAYAPALMLALPGLWCLWRDGGSARRLGVEIALATGALAATVGAYQMWWGGSAAPGRQVGAALLLLGVPIARWTAHVAAEPLRRALVRALVLIGLAVSLAMVVGRAGLLVANGRDGTSQLLEWLGPGHELARALPSAIAMRDRPAVFFGVVAIWLAAALAASWLARRWRQPSAGHAGAAAGLLAFGAVVAGATMAPLLLGDQVPAPAPPEARVESTMLQDFDARRRPLAIVYDPWRRVDAAEIPPMFRFDGTASTWRPRQPLRVLFNTRLSLPAGDYEVRLMPNPGAALRGTVGLQVGRAGPPMHEWTVDRPVGAEWNGSFRLGVDGNFVGLRAAPEFDALAAGLEIVPRHVQDRSERPELPPVLSAMRYGPVDVYFHSTDVYPERTGFWVRGRESLPATFVQAPPADTDPALTLRVHSGAAAGSVRFATPVWQTTVDLEPGGARDVRIPARPGTRFLTVTITPASGFVPAERNGGDDRRLLGCWVEVVN